MRMRINDSINTGIDTNLRFSFNFIFIVCGVGVLSFLSACSPTLSLSSEEIVDLRSRVQRLEKKSDASDQHMEEAAGMLNNHTKILNSILAPQNQNSSPKPQQPAEKPPTK